LKSPDIIERFSSIGAEVMGGSVENFANFHKAEHAKWSQFIKATGIKAP
jgi:hypothetical protein